jgi:glutamate-ammonia-ligase adenylyltransferase
MVAGDVVEMRKAIAAEKGDSDRWNLKYVGGGLVDIEFITQYLQLVHAAQTPEILDTSTTRVLDKAWRLGLLATEDAEVLRPAVRLYHDLTQILRLCLPGPFDPLPVPPPHSASTRASDARLRGLWTHVDALMQGEGRVGAAPGLAGLLARAADVPDFATLDAFIVEMQAKVRASFGRILGALP